VQICTTNWSGTRLSRLLTQMITLALVLSHLGPISERALPMSDITTKSNIKDRLRSNVRLFTKSFWLTTTIRPANSWSWF
jgi:hypothetical protein